MKQVWRSWKGVPLALVLLGSGVLGDSSSIANDPGIKLYIWILLVSAAAAVLILGVVWSSSQQLDSEALKKQFGALHKRLRALEERLDKITQQLADAAPPNEAIPSDDGADARKSS